MPRAKKQRLKQRGDGRYACRYKNQWFYGKTQEEALEQREQYKQIERRGMYAPLTVREYADKWFDRAHPEISKPTRVNLKIHLKKLLDAIGGLSLDDVRPSDIKAIYSERYIGLSNAYIKAGKQLFCALFDAAQADGYIPTNPARDRTAKPHKGTEGTHRAITPQERQWIETLCTDHRAYPAVMTMLYAGIRPQEMKAVKIERDFDFKANTLTLHEFAHVSGRQYVHTTEGKTKLAARTIPLFSPLKKAVQGHKGFLITDIHGGKVGISAWRNVWESYVHCMETAINGISKRWYGRTKEQKRLLEEGKLQPWVEFTVVPYDLRHSFCTMCRSAGVELKTCVRWMGHKDAKMVLQIYDEVTEDRSANEAKKLEKTLIRSQKVVRPNKKNPQRL